MSKKEYVNETLSICMLQLAMPEQPEMNDLVPASDTSQESESPFGALKMGHLTQDFNIRAPGDEIRLASGILDGGAIKYYDSSYAVLMGLDIDTHTKLQKGERLAILDTGVAPAGPGRVCVIPYSWHERELQKYADTRKMPKGLIFVAVPEDIVQDEDQLEEDKNKNPSKGRLQLLRRIPRRK